MTMGDRGKQPFALRSAPPLARHVGRRPGLVDKNKARRIKIKLAVEPVLPPFHDMWAPQGADAEGKTLLASFA